MTINNNADTAEINKFRQFSSRWWDTNGNMKPLHDINPLRLSFIQSNAVLNEQEVLDIGCGGGILSESLAKAKASVTAIDMCDDMIAVAKLHALEGKLNINYHHMSSSQAVAKGQQYDIVTCMELLEHVVDPALLITDCAKLLKPGGKVFFSTINRNPKAYAFAILGAEYLLGMLPKGTHEYRKFIKPAELARWCRQAGLNIKQSKGMTYNPITKTYALSKNTDVNYLVYAEKNHD